MGRNTNNQNTAANTESELNQESADSLNQNSAEEQNNAGNVSDTSSAENADGKTEGDTENPKSDPPEITPPESTGKRRVQHLGLKNKKLVVGSEIVEFDGEGCAEVSAEQADYLLSIPSYKAI